MSNRITKTFYELNTLLKSLRPEGLLPNLLIKDNNLLRASKSISVPKPFKPFIDIIYQNTGFKLPDDWKFTSEEVRQIDNETIERFSNKNFDFSKLRSEYLIAAAIESGRSLGFFSVDAKFTNITDSAKSFPSSSSASYPTYKKKGDLVSINDAVSFVDNFLNNASSIVDLLSQPTTIFHRFQYKFSIDKPDEINKKIRPIWGISFRISVLEGYFYRDLVSKVSDYVSKSHEYVSTYGRDLVQVSDDIISSFKSSGVKLLSLDLKYFDSTIPSYMWSLFGAVTFNSIEFPPEYTRHFFDLISFYNYTPYVYGSTKVSFQRKGNPSGLLVTSLFNTFVNLTVLNYAYLEYTHGKSFATGSVCVLGDDNLIKLNLMSESHIFSVYERFGLVINKDKTKVTEAGKPFSFVGYNWDEQCRPTQSRSWFISHYCLPSTYFINQDIPISLLMTYRAISISFPLFNGFTEFMHLIGFTDKVFSDIYDSYKINNNCKFEFITTNRRLQNISIPLKYFIDFDWRRNSSIVSLSNAP